MFELRYSSVILKKMFFQCGVMQPCTVTLQVNFFNEGLYTFRINLPKTCYYTASKQLHGFTLHENGQLGLLPLPNMYRMHGFPGSKMCFPSNKFFKWQSKGENTLEINMQRWYATQHNRRGAGNLLYYYSQIVEPNESNESDEKYHPLFNCLQHIATHSIEFLPVVDEKYRAKTLITLIDSLKQDAEKRRQLFEKKPDVRS